MRTVLSILAALILFPLITSGQQRADTVAVRESNARATVRKEKRTLNDFMPSGLRIGPDVISIVRTTSSNSFQGWEVNADIDFYRYYLSVDFGSWSRDLVTLNQPGSDDDDVYSNSGNYFRAGVDVNFLLKDPDRNMAFLGLRYGQSAFDESLSSLVGDSLWSSVRREQYMSTDASAHWFELTGGLKVKIWKMIWMGYTARYKFGLRYSDGLSMIPHDVPGYGTNDKNFTWGFNYNIMIRIPFRKTPKPPGSNEKQ